MATDMIQIDREQFEQMVEEMQSYIGEVKQLKIANDFLNDQIKEYNQKFVDPYQKQVDNYKNKFGE